MKSGRKIFFDLFLNFIINSYFLSINNFFDSLTIFVFTSNFSGNFYSLEIIFLFYAKSDQTFSDLADLFSLSLSSNDFAIRQQCSYLTFLLMNAVPGSPWLSEKSPTEATLAALNAKYGLDQPVYVQLFKYLGNLAHGDFGVSLKMQKNRPVLSIILEMFPVSAKIGAIALAWAVLVGVPLGCLAAFKRGKMTDSILRVVCTLGISSRVSWLHLYFW